MARHKAIDHALEDHRHGYVVLHLNDQEDPAAAVDAVSDQSVATENVAVARPRNVDGLVVQYIEDTDHRNRNRFHLVLGAIAALRLTLTDARNRRYFAWEHHY